MKQKARFKWLSCPSLHSLVPEQGRGGANLWLTKSLIHTRLRKAFLSRGSVVDLLIHAAKVNHHSYYPKANN